MRRFLSVTFGCAALVVCAPAGADSRVFEKTDETKPGLQSLDLYGWVQPRVTLPQNDERTGVNYKPNPAFTVRRARLGAVAQIAPWLKAQVELELTPAVDLFDAFLVAAPIPEATFTAGQFRVPFSRQNMLPSKGLQFPDLAYFIAAKFVVDRDIGMMMSGELFEKKLKYYAGMYNGNDPGRNQKENNDEYFLFAGRVEVAPFGPAPRFEGDLRSLEDRKQPRVMVGLGGMRNRLEDKKFHRTYLGADLSAYWMGASLYAELYGRRDTNIDGPTCKQGLGGWIFKDDYDPNVGCTTAVGWNLQAGYFPPIGWAEEHVEVAVRLQRFDPNREVRTPPQGARELDSSNPAWGYTGFTFGVNVFATKTHDAKLQAAYEVRNETKECLEGQVKGSVDKPCTGFIRNNQLVVQLTAAF